jgi:hypothetical protein
MVTTYQRLKELFPSLNRRRITWRMVQRAARKLDAPLFCRPLKLDGYFVPAGASLSGRPEIYVNVRLSEDLQIATAVHEIKHAAFDRAPGRILFSHRREWTRAARRELEQHDRAEFEACAMAVLALLPVPRLRRASLGLFEADDEFIVDLWRIRLDVREIYGI